jgi:flagellar motor protein MotB
MMRPRLYGWWALLASMAAAGCQSGPFGSQAQLTKLQADMDQLARQNRELAERAGTLDRDNQEHAKLLAQSQQQLRLREDELAAVREQLREVTAQVATLQTEKADAEKETQALVASTRRGGGATIRANNTLKDNLPQFNTNDIQVRVDGDVVRMGIVADRLFQPGTAQLTADAAALIDLVAVEIARRYPEQVIGIEGHTDGDAAASAMGSGSAGHPLALAQAAAVFQQIVARGRLRPSQLFIAAHGANFPMYSNAHPDGRARNRRIELVVYPDRAR